MAQRDEFQQKADDFLVMMTDPEPVDCARLTRWQRFIRWFYCQKL